MAEQESGPKGSDRNQKLIRQPNVVFAAVEFVAKYGHDSAMSQNHLMMDLIANGVTARHRRPEIADNMERAGYNAGQDVRLNAARWPHTLEDLNELVDWLRANGCDAAADAFVKGMTLAGEFAAAKMARLDEA